MPARHAAVVHEDGGPGVAADDRFTRLERNTPPPSNEPMREIAACQRRATLGRLLHGTPEGLANRMPGRMNRDSCASSPIASRTSANKLVTVPSETKVSGQR